MKGVALHTSSVWRAFRIVLFLHLIFAKSVQPSQLANLGFLKCSCIALIFIQSSGPAVIGYAVAVTLPSLLFFDSLFSFIVIISYVIVTAKLIK